MTAPVLLVHGAFLGAWAWDAVIVELDSRGVRALALDLPSQGEEGSLIVDADAVRQALDEVGEPAVLVGQSYGGMVITEAGVGNDSVAHLVYVCAAMPHGGENVASIMGRDPHPTTLGEGIRMVGEGPMATLDPETARALPGHDVPDDAWEGALPRMGRHNMATFEQATTAQAWNDHPSTYVVTTLDTVFSPDLQREMAQSAGAIVEIETSHFPMLSRPAELAGILAGIAEKL